MTTLRQSNMMHTTSSSHHNNSHDDNLDMLLEDLHSSVSRPGSSLAMNGPVTSGYREVTRTVTNQGLNGPESSTEYQIEYLNPANSTTVIAERAASPNLDILTDTSDLPPGSRKMASYKVSTYQYKTSGGNPVHETNTNGDVRMRQNINELDSLLDDLHTAQKTGFSADNSSLVKKTSGYDSSLIEPIETSTPKGGHVSRSVERKVYQEQRYGSVGRQSPAREIIKQDHSYRPDASPLRQRKEMYKYESKTTRSVGGNAREISPPSPPPIRSSSGHSPSRQGHTVRSYNYTSSSDQDIIRTPTMHHRSPSPTAHRSPSPSGKTVRSYNYSSNRTHEYTTDGGGYSHSQPQPPYRSPSPLSRRAQNYTTSTTTTNQETHRGPIRSQSPSPGPRTTVHSYNYSSSTKDTKQEVPKTPPPHRSPSPVSFISPPMPNTKSTTVKTYNFEQSPRPQSPQQPQKFSPSDPSRTLNYQVSPPPNQSNVYSYKYSSHTSSSSKYPPEEHVPLLPRPFPTPSPTPDQQQQPPKKLDDLMASFSDTEIQQHHYNESHRYNHQQPQQHPIKQHPQPVVAAESYPPPAPAPQTNANNIDNHKSKNVAGPPVYYPPGVELFSKKEEVFTQQQSGAGGGKMKAKAKGKYEYESKSKSKEKSKTGKTVVPVCLPVCCAMPCVIM